jgi:HD-GYP domain-containing protein (c-di-GMP phosphodiesterase class II)
MLQGSNDSSVRFVLAEATPFLIITEDLLARLKRWVKFCVEQEGIQQAWIGRVDEKNTIHWMTGWPSEETPDIFSVSALRSVPRTKEIFTFRNHDELISGGLFPLIRNDRVVGVLGLMSHQTDTFKPGTIKWINALATLISENLFERDDTNEEKLCEQEITRILQSSIDVRDRLPKILELLAQAFKADALIMLSYVPQANRFELGATHGLSMLVIAKLRLFFEAGLAGRAFERHQPAWIEDMQMTRSEMHPISRMNEEGYRGYLAFPLIGHNDLTGMIEVLWREPQSTKHCNWEFIERVAEQIAFAVQRAGILRDIRQQNTELLTKYNAMIEGLSRALELRDIETEGHTRRVSRFAVRLAEHMGIPSDEWDAIRQGALLHDIGKLGISDDVLLKPESLNARERKIMQQHVHYGYNLLAHFISARHTLDITLYHHERWDGKGYPYGLKAEQIPLVARLFSIIDVFDALKSDRPYRPAWAYDQVLIYLREQAGGQFDPHIVRLFLEIADEMV